MYEFMLCYGMIWYVCKYACAKKYVPKNNVHEWCIQCITHMMTWGGLRAAQCHPGDLSPHGVSGSKHQKTATFKWYPPENRGNPTHVENWEIMYK